ncbi:MAG: O-antigen ligase family protein, partial [Chloroflexi bacterium]|nr:O-antigen ligase family protein [Chloroflexota bacterium]
LALLISLSAISAILLRRANETSGATIGLPDPALDPRPNNTFAVNVALESATPPQIGWALDTIRDAGFGWIKQSFRWAEIEPVRGQFNWAASDRIVEGAKDRGVGVVAVLITTPEWARADHNVETVPPLDAADFANFARAFAARYADRVNVYQIWDEPNLASAWGRPDSAADYLRILKPAYLAIHRADPNATVLLAALAPTVETGPNNLSDLLYLRALYLAGAAPYFDAVSAKPYGFGDSPAERETDPNHFNFSRMILLRQEMVAHGDGHKLLWAGNFGWNALPENWGGEKSIWGKVSEAAQADYTAQAYARAIAEWPWAGPMALENFQPDPDPPGLNPFANAPENDPRWGFALADSSGRPRPVLSAVRALASETRGLLPGNHAATDPAVGYEGDWKFSELGADIPRSGPAKIVFDFVGTDLAVRVRRADYRAYLYVTIDGQPSRLLPHDSRGTYLVLTSPDLFPRVETLPIASGLRYGKHTAVIEAERGWDQWAVVGFSVGRSLDNRLESLGLAIFGVLALLFAFDAARAARRVDFGLPWSRLRDRFGRLTALGQTVITSIFAGLLWLSAWLTWGGELPQLTRRLGDTTPLVATLLTAGVFYISPWLLLTVISIAALFVLFYLRLDVALALIALFAPFYLQPRPLFDKVFSMVEITTLLATAAWVLRRVAESITTKTQRHKGTKKSELSGLVPSSLRGSRFPYFPVSFSSLDWSVLFFLAVAFASIFAADIRGVATREFRVIVLEPALFYFLLRVTPLDRKGLWRIVDFFVMGAVVVAAIGLYQYVTKTNLIAAEGGVLRLRSVFGSPNNVGLYLGRAVPILAAIVLMGQDRWRRIAYLGAALIVLPALALSFSKGALLVGVPASLAVVLIFWGGRWAVAGLGAALVAALGLALGPLSRNPRFANLFDVQSGTSFFRVRLWQSALYMIRDHPLLGVGLDNFLYAYRGRYINPEAWQDQNLSHPHNVVLDFAARLGLFGLASFVWMQVAFFITAWKALTPALLLSPSRAKPLARETAPTPLATRHPSLDSRALAIGLIASMVDFLAHGLVDASYFFVDLAFVYFLTLGLAAVLASHRPPPLWRNSAQAAG